MRALLVVMTGAAAAHCPPVIGTGLPKAGTRSLAHYMQRALGYETVKYSGGLDPLVAGFVLKDHEFYDDYPWYAAPCAFCSYLPECELRRHGAKLQRLGGVGHPSAFLSMASRRLRFWRVQLEYGQVRVSSHVPSLRAPGERLNRRRLPVTARRVRRRRAAGASIRGGVRGALPTRPRVRPSVAVVRGAARPFLQPHRP